MPLPFELEGRCLSVSVLLGCYLETIGIIVQLYMNPLEALGSLKPLDFGIEILNQCGTTITVSDSGHPHTPHYH